MPIFDNTEPPPVTLQTKSLPWVLEGQTSDGPTILPRIGLATTSTTLTAVRLQKIPVGEAVPMIVKVPGIFQVIFGVLVSPPATVAPAGVTAQVAVPFA